MMLVDPRRGSGELLKPLKRAGVPVREKYLTFADFKFTSGPGYAPSTHDSDTEGEVAVGVERKKVDELLGAVHDSRFRRKQVQGLLTSYPSHAWLLVEGPYEADKEGILLRGKVFTSKRGTRMAVLHEAGFTRERHLYENFAKFQHTMHVKARLLSGRTISPEETVAWLASLYRWYQKPYKKHKSAYVVDETKPDHVLLTKDSYERRVLAQLPGVGWERSKDIEKFMAEHRLDLTSMFAQPVRVWREALNFKEGRIIARTIVNLLQARQARHAS